MQLAEEGVFRGQIFSIGLTQGQKTESVGITIGVSCTERLDAATGTWHEVPMPWPEVEGTVWIVRKDGGPNDNAEESFRQATGWNGKLEQIIDPEWKPGRIEVITESEIYKDKRRVRIAFINPIEKVRGVQPISENKLASIAAKLERARSGACKHQAGGELLFLDAAGDLRGLARRLREPRPGGVEVYLVDREWDLRRLREAATLLGLLGLACGLGLV